jgi:hypothetical protein
LRLPSLQPDFMARAAPIGDSLRDALDIFFESGDIGDSLLRRSAWVRHRRLSPSCVPPGPAGILPACRRDARGPNYPAATSRMVKASAWARGTSVSIRHHSSSRWALPPTGPVPHKVAVPSAAVKPCRRNRRSPRRKPGNRGLQPSGRRHRGARGSFHPARAAENCPRAGCGPRCRAIRSSGRSRAPRRESFP